MELVKITCIFVNNPSWEGISPDKQFEYKKKNCPQTTKSRRPNKNLFVEWLKE